MAKEHNMKHVKMWLDGGISRGYITKGQAITLGARITGQSKEAVKKAFDGIRQAEHEALIEDVKKVAAGNGPLSEKAMAMAYLKTIGAN